MIAGKLHVVGIVTICGAIGFPAVASLLPKPMKNPLKLSDIALTRAMRMVVALPPPIGAPPLFTISQQMPPDIGIAITEVGGVPHHFVGCSVRLRIEVNGVPRASILFPASAKALSRYSFDPPIIARPGDALSFTFTAPQGSEGVCSLQVANDAVPEFSIGGWRLEPGEV